MLNLRALLPDTSFDPRIPQPVDVVGPRAAQRPLHHHEIVAVAEALAAASPHVALRRYGVSHEGRDLLMMVVASRQILGDVESFLARHRAVLDGHQQLGEGDDHPAVMWFGHGVHGDELSTVEAALALAYWLVAADDVRARAARRELVVLIDPLQNPDGRERHLSLIRAFQHKGPSPDPEDLSHRGVWPWGRGNHYLTDLNRDWITLVQPESQSRVAEFLRWMPQVAVDVHEMWPDSTFLFSPPRAPFNPHLPQTVRSWWKVFAEDQAHRLDERGFPYYRGEWNEEIFPGYGSSFASYHGAVGILYEMADTGGTLIHQRGGGRKTFREAVTHHLVSALANLSTLLHHRRALLDDHIGHRRRMAQEGPGGQVGAWYFPAVERSHRAHDLVDLLRRLGVEVEVLTEPLTLARAVDGRSGAAGRLVLPAGSYRVSTRQPAGALVRTLLDPHNAMDLDFLAEERRELERCKPSRLYDTTAWSLPLTFDVDAYWTEDVEPGPWARELSGGLQAVATPAPEAVALVVEGLSDRSMVALARLLDAGVRVRVGERPFTVGGEHFHRGAFAVRRDENDADAWVLAADLVQRYRLRHVAARTSASQQGPDLGGHTFHPLLAPRIGIFAGNPVRPDSYGALWHLLDETLGLRFNGLDLNDFGEIDLARYNVLVLPCLLSRETAYHAVLNKAGVKRLGAWVEGGGTVIGLRAGALFLADPKVKMSRCRSRRRVLDHRAPLVLGPPPASSVARGPWRAEGWRPDTAATAGARAELADRAWRPLIGPGAAPFVEYEGFPLDEVPALEMDAWLEAAGVAKGDKMPARERSWADDRLRRFMPSGALVSVDLDRDHWLSYGMGETVAVVASASEPLVAAPPVEVVGRYASPERLHLGGLLWPEAAGRLAQTAFLTRERVGRGQVVCFADMPVLRNATPATTRLFLNALLVGPGRGTDWPRRW